MKVDKYKDKQADVIADVLSALITDDKHKAAEIARKEYCFSPYQSVRRRYSEYQSMRVFLRDSFTDRYSGQRLIFPGLLRMLSVILPEEFPAHKHWKMSESHIVYWELFPTIDHIIPVARGGEDVEDNWVTTSMLRNQAKGHWLLEELGWSLKDRTQQKEWDGLTRMTLDYLDKNPERQSIPYLKRWYRAAKRSMESELETV